MGRPTIKSSGPDVFGRTEPILDQFARRAEFGPIRPMEERRGLSSLLGRLIAPGN